MLDAFPRTVPSRAAYLSPVSQDAGVQVELHLSAPATSIERMVARGAGRRGADDR